MSTTPSALPRISPLDAVQQAMEHTRRHLFPFRFERWLALGFVAFLDQCGRTQSSFRLPFGLPEHRGGGSGGGDQGAGRVFSEAGAWLAAHVMMVMAIAAVAIVLILCLTALVLWINSRGVFMYVDNVATGRADVSRPWREHAAKADSYFAWTFGVMVAVLIAGMVVLVCAALVAIRMAQGHGSVAPGVVVLILLVVVFLVLLLFSVLAALALRDFVAPLQMRTGLSCGAAINLFLVLLRAHPGTFAVYVLLKIVFSLVLAFAVLLAACFTCCCALIPVVNQTLLQPVYFFERAFPLCLLRQLGYDLLPPLAAPAGPPPAAALPDRPPPASDVPFGSKEEPPHVL